MSETNPAQNSPSLAKSRLKSILDVVATIVMIAAAIAVGYQAMRKPSFSPAVAAPSAPPLPVAPISLKGSHIVGSSSALFVILEYTDYECPFCGKSEREVLDLIRKKYVDTGKFQFAVRHMPLGKAHPRARPAAVAAECGADQGKFWEMHGLLFQDSQKLSDEDFLHAASASGLDLPAFKRCLAEPKAQNVIDADLASARVVGVKGTPMFYVGRLQGDQELHVRLQVEGYRTVADFSAILDHLLAMK